jgi:NAD(P)-dependent dehydrogenase (short-subunit alcohol dehydrogenase family)
MTALEGKVAVVVGGTSGIGACIAELFVAEGARVLVAGRREDAGRDLVDRVGHGAAFLRADVTVEDDIVALVATAVDRYGGLDCVVNSAGEGGGVGPVGAADVDAFMHTIHVHVGGALIVTKHAARVMQDQQRGSIVNLASIGGQLGGWTAHDYAAAKAGVIHLTRSVAVELAAARVRVNALSPGPTLTGIFGKAAGIAPDQADRTADALEDVFSSRLEQWQPLPKVARPDDIAPVAVWLASDASRFVTGQNIVADGGITAGRPFSAAAADRAAMAAVLSPRAADHTTVECPGARD